MKKAIYLVIGLITLLSSCKKETTPSTKDLLTANNWAINNYTAADDAPQTLNFLNNFKTRVNNSVYLKFNNDGTFLYSDSSDYGKWELSGDKKIIFSKGTPSEYSSTIDKLNSTEFVQSFIVHLYKDITFTEYTVKK